MLDGNNDEMNKCVMVAPEDDPGTIPKVGLEAAMGGCNRLA